MFRWCFSEILPEALIWKPFSVQDYDYNFSGSLLYDEPVFSDDIDDFGKASKIAGSWLHINSFVGSLFEALNLDVCCVEVLQGRR